MSEYIMNNETGKIELHFDKADYMALDEASKKEIKSNFLFSRYAGVWVSRCKFPNTYRAEEIAKKLGLEDGGKVGEILTFEEQQEIKARKAENRAERYEHKSEKAQEEAERLQAPINRMHGDIAFFTQPNINTSAGRAFTRKRNRMFEAWEKGFESFKRSEYYSEAAERARKSAEKPSDKGFCDRRIKEAEKTIRAQEKNISEYEKTLAKITAGEEVKNWRGEVLTAEAVEGWIERAELIVEQAISKATYYHQCIEDLGGIQFDKTNLKAGQIVKLTRWKEPVRIKKCNPTTIVYEFLLPHMTYADGSPMTGKAAYSEIEEVV